MSDSLLTELKRRNVFKVGVAYLVMAWVVVQISSEAVPALHLPDWVNSLVFYLTIIGFPFALFFAWAFEITPDGIKRESDVAPEETVTTSTGQKLNIFIIGLLVVALGYFIYESRFKSQPAETTLAKDVTTEIEPLIEVAQATEKPSIAVLPFVNMSSDPEQEYFSDGISEEILNLLAKIPELKVTSRTSVFTFKNQNVDIPTVAEKLGVKHILEGSVRKADDRIRITAQLIEASADVHLWSETYERKLDDIFAIQDEIAKEVVNALQIQLLGEAPSAASTNIEAYKLYLRGKHFVNLGTRESLESSIKAFKQAISLDANFAPPWEGLSRALRLQGFYGFTDLQVAMGASRQAAVGALELDDKLAEAWVALATIQFYYDWDWALAEVSTGIALEYGPQNAQVLRLGTWVALGLGETERAQELAQLAVDLDPLDFSGLVNLGTTYWALGQLDEEENAYRHILELYPESVNVKSWLAALLAAKGKPEEGLQYLIFDSKGRWQRVFSAVVLHSLGRHEEEKQLRQKLIDDKGHLWAFHIAVTYAWHGNHDKAFEWLDIAFEQKDYYMNQLIYNPWLSSLHDDQRWEVILERIGLLKYWKRSQTRREKVES